MFFSQPVNDIIRRRYSCRTYARKPIIEETRRELTGFIENLPRGPFAGQHRFMLAAATDRDSHDLRGLGTYGFIKDPPGFIIGGSLEAPHHLEDFGYLMECVVLAATDLGLGTCWLGGSFTRSGFASRIHAAPGEIIPAVCSVGYAAQTGRMIDRVIRKNVRANERLAWPVLFFEETFEKPLARESAGDWAEVLEMLRLAPSASNKQPWRVVKQGRRWHFFLQRSAAYRENLVARSLGVADMQRVDMGIAMCHFELSAQSAGKDIQWELSDPGLPLPDALTEYVVSARMKPEAGSID